MENSFTLNYLMIFAGVFLIPVFIWFINQRQTQKTLLYGGLLFLVFSTGTLEIIGLSTTYIRLITEVLILIIFGKGVLLKSLNKSRKLPGIGWLFLFLIVSWFSTLENELGMLNYVLFLRDYIFVILLFYGVANIKIKDKEIYLLKKLVIYLFIAQIGANIVKYLVFQDIIEPYIGTMANLGGSLTAIFAMIGSVYAITHYFEKGDKKYLGWIIAFIGFSFLGGKRATIVFLPIIFLLLLIINQWKFDRISFRFVSHLSLITILTFLIFYLSVRILPTLNPERQVWGTFDAEYALDYSERYVTTGAGAIERIGRAQAPAYLLQLYLNADTYTFLTGNGAGHLVKSSFNEEVQQAGSRNDLTEVLYGVGYGTRTTVLQIFLQVGLIGVVLYILSFLTIYKKLKNKYLNSIQIAKWEVLFFYGMWMIFFIDMFTYSTVMISITSVSIVMFLYLGIVVQQDDLH